MASGNYNYEQDQYYYYHQQYPPQFYYDPQNFYQPGVNTPNYYYQPGDYHTSYYQGGDNSTSYYNQRGDNLNYRGNRQNTGRGINHSSTHGKEVDRTFKKKSIDDLTSKDSYFHAVDSEQKQPEHENEKSTGTNKYRGQEKYFDNNRGRGKGSVQHRGQEKFSDNNRGRGRDTGQHQNSRQFHRSAKSNHNRKEDFTVARDSSQQLDSSTRAQGGSNHTKKDKYAGEDNRRRDVHQSGNRSHFRENYFRGHHQYKDSENLRQGGQSVDSDNRQRFNHNKDTNKHYVGGAKDSPRHIEMDDRLSFDKRNNSKVNENEGKREENTKTDKQYKLPSTDRNYTSKKQLMKKVMAGKVDETQRGLLIEQLTLGTYECMVCCDTVKCHHAVWNCPGCYHAFHLICIKKWARSPAALLDGAGSGWRCPACQKVTDKFPNQYKCFCGKIRDPEYDRREIPHSCGQVCQKNRGDNCSHPCNILCHPGPCPPCSAVVNRTCACGKESKSVKCSVTEVMKCENVCSKVLNCGKHFCKATCHSGSCDPCEEIIIKECYGSHEKKEVKCGCAESFSKSYSCDKPCKRTLICSKHECDMTCHAGDCKTCELLPDLVTHCPCGATPLSEIATTNRTSCTDPIPVCNQVCNKPLGCGPADKIHRCQQKCHEGPCGPCDGVTSLTCRCGAIDKDVPCAEVHQYTDDKPFTCDKRCNKKRTCGRHKCGQLCCVSEEHICNQLCNKKLSCGLHKCEEQCHRGNCPPCLMSDYDELTCHCGAEMMLPPIPCGTKPPECKNVCSRQHECDHTVYHHCHSDAECPPCAVLTEKWCMGNHELRKNIPCHLNNVSCGLPCNKVLPCQQHKCQKTCHSGDCQKEGEACSQSCRIKRKDCSHLCGAPCHQGQPCPHTPCKAEVLLICKCGNKEAKVPCMSGSPQDTAEYQKLTMQSLQSGQPVDLSQLGKKKFKRQLDCDSECSLLERNRRIALALEIKNPDLGAKLVNPTYTDFLKDYAKQNAHFVSSVEKALTDLVKMAKQSKHQHRSHAFSPGNRDQRRAIHELAEFYGCETQSYDYEPKKNVVATAYRDKCWLPSVTLTSFIQRELHPKAPLPIPHVHNEATLRQTAQAAKQSTDVLSDIKLSSRWEFTKTDSKRKSSKPEIDYFDFSTN